LEFSADGDVFGLEHSRRNEKKCHNAD
jgi:hypothetical protein